MSDPTMTDAALAMPEAGDVLSLVAQQMERDRQHRQNFFDTMLIEARAEAKAMRDGVEAALRECESGGTTRQYETTLAQIDRALCAARYPCPIRDWYREREAKAWADGCAHNEEIHPLYQPGGGWA